MKVAQWLFAIGTAMSAVYWMSDFDGKSHYGPAVAAGLVGLLIAQAPLTTAPRLFALAAVCAVCAWTLATDLGFLP